MGMELFLDFFYGFVKVCLNKLNKFEQIFVGDKKNLHT